jgi:hypothetical protein
MVNQQGDSWCRRCGTRLARAPQVESVHPAPPAAGYSLVPEYGLPQQAQQSYAHGGGVWRDDKMLVMHKTARLPEYCIKCGAPLDRPMLPRTLRWQHPALALLLLAGLPGLILYFIIALIVRKTARVDIGICEEHAGKRRTAILVSWLIFLLSLAFIALAIVQESGGSALFGVLLFLMSLIYAIGWAKLVRVKKIDEHYVCLKGIDETFLSMFPILPRR